MKAVLAQVVGCCVFDEVKQIMKHKGGSPGLVVMGGDSCPKVMSSNHSTVYWMEIFSHLFVVKIVMCV